MRRLILLICMMCATIGAMAQTMSLIPAPRSYTSAAQGYDITYKTTICCDEGAIPAANYLADKLGIKVSSQGDIYLAIDDRLGAEAYQLSVYTDGIIIVGGDYGGVFNGVTTLLQLLPAEVYSSNLTLPCSVKGCAIEDAPRYEHRGFMLDVCRTWIDKEALLSYIDLLAYHKINSLRLHLTDDEAWRIEIKSHPELAKVGGYRGGDSPIWPRYGKWNKKWGGYYTQDDMREIITYAAQRNIEIVPEIDLPGHSLCLATIHPEVLCRYDHNTAAALGYDVRSVICPSNERNYKLLDDILREVSSLFPSEYIHVGGDEVDFSQWKRCPDCRAFMQRTNMSTTEELQAYFMLRLSEILEKYGKRMAIWDDVVNGNNMPVDTHVYGWQSVNRCRSVAAAGYPTIVMPGDYFYFDMKQSEHEPGHDWAAIFDMSKVYNFSPAAVGFTANEQKNIIGLEASFFSEAYASRNPESPAYLHYQTFPRLLAFAEVAWIGTDSRNWDGFHKRVVDYYDNLDAMGVYYRLEPPVVEYENGKLSASVSDESTLFYRQEGSDRTLRYLAPIATNTPAAYRFVSRRALAISPTVAVDDYFEVITPAFDITSSMSDRAQYSFDKAEGYGRIARTRRAATIGDWVMFTFAEPVECRSMKVATGNFQLPRYIFESGDVYVSYDGENFTLVGKLKAGAYVIENSPQPIKAVRIVCTSRGNGAEWVSIQPPTIYPVIK